VSFSTQSPATDSAVVDLDDAPRRRLSSETKASFKTTELIAYVVVALGILIAAAVVDDAGRQGFGADHAWLYVTILTVGYMVSRGLAKAGSYEHDNDPRT